MKGNNVDPEIIVNQLCSNSMHVIYFKALFFGYFKRIFIVDKGRIGEATQVEPSRWRPNSDKKTQKRRLSRPALAVLVALGKCAKQQGKFAPSCKGNLQRVLASRKCDIFTCLDSAAAFVGPSGK